MLASHSLSHSLLMLMLHEQSLLCHVRPHQSLGSHQIASNSHCDGMPYLTRLPTRILRNCGSPIAATTLDLPAQYLPSYPHLVKSAGYGKIRYWAQSLIDTKRYASPQHHAPSGYRSAPHSSFAAAAHASNRH